MTDKLSHAGSSGNVGSKVELKRNLKVTNCVSLLIAVVIGSGIFISPKVGSFQRRNNIFLSPIKLCQFLGCYRRNRISRLCAYNLGVMWHCVYIWRLCIRWARLYDSESRRWIRIHNGRFWQRLGVSFYMVVCGHYNSGFARFGRFDLCRLRIRTILSGL